MLDSNQGNTKSVKTYGLNIFKHSLNLFKQIQKTCVKSFEMRSNKFKRVLMKHLTMHDSNVNFLELLFAQA